MLILAGVCVVALGAGGIVGICTEAARYNEFPSSMLSPLFISALIFMIMTIPFRCAESTKGYETKTSHMRF